MKDLVFQQKAVRKLVNETIELLRQSGNRKTIIFKAPTGAGKIEEYDAVICFFQSNFLFALQASD